MNIKDRRCSIHKSESFYGFCYKENKMMCQMCATKDHILHFDKHINFYQVFKRDLKQIKNVLNEDGAAYEKQLNVLQASKGLTTESLIQDFDNINVKFQEDLQFNLDKIYKDTTSEFLRITDKMKASLTAELTTAGFVKDLDEEFNLIFNINKLHASVQEQMKDPSTEMSKVEDNYAQAVKEFQKIDHKKCALFDLKMQKIKHINEVNKFSQSQIKNHTITLIQQKIQQGIGQTKYLEQYVDVNIDNMVSSIKAIKLE